MANLITAIKDAIHPHAAASAIAPPAAASPSAHSIPSSKLPAAVSFFGPLDADRVKDLQESPPASWSILLTQTRRYLENPSALPAAANALGLDLMRVHIIMGNEASDMDSMVSALVLAWYLSTVYPPASGNVFVPLINIPRKELALRGESVFSFRQIGLDPALLVFLDDVDFTTLQRRSSLGLILVDHNRLSVSQEHLSAFVVGLVDHHKDEGMYPMTKEHGNRIVESAASCTSLIGRLIFARAPWLFTKSMLPQSISAEGNMPPALAVLTLLEHVLLLDSDNFSADTGKTTSTDREVSKQYDDAIKSLTYAELKRRRADVSSLSAGEMLLKDVKVGENRTYSHSVNSIPSPLASCDGLVKEAGKYATEKGHRFVVTLHMSSDSSGKLVREVLLVMVDSNNSSSAGNDGAEPKPNGSRPGLLRAVTTSFADQSPNVPAKSGVLGDKELFEGIKKGLESSDLDLVPLDSPKGELVQAYTQRNNKASRKQVTPLMEKILAAL